MRILVLIHEYPPVGGGGGRVAQDICQGLTARGHEVQVLSAHWGDLPYNELDGKVALHRVVPTRKQPYQAGFVTMAGYVLASAWNGLKLIRRWRPDIIHAHFAVPAGASAWALSILTGVPYILTAHLGDVPGGAPEKTGRWFRWVFPLTPMIWKRAVRINAVSSFTRQLILNSYPVDVGVIPNGVDLDALQPGPLQTHELPTIIFAGRFMDQKNPVQIVRSLAAIQDLSWQCTLIGDGPLRPQVEAEIARHGLAERIHLEGWVTPQEVLEHFRHSDILFMPSRSEGLPVTGVQGLAMGLAVVASDIGGFKDVVEHAVNGMLIPVDQPSGYAQALRSLLTTPEQLLAFRRASRAMAERFELSRVIPAYEQMLVEACQACFEDKTTEKSRQV
ncbi:MAG TPA: glycosyltransferase family 4 protein [Levilinea sp.]|nr:glycosyltransferase family 4 protein [Levilinea sp.]